MRLLTAVIKNPYCRSLVFLLLFLISGAFLQLRNDRFTCLKIQNNFYPQAASAETRLDPALLPILEQKFTYYRRGAQAFVFLSEDGNYVLKIFNNRLHRQMQWYSHLPFFKEESLFLQKKLQAVSESYHIANQKLKEESSLLYAHLQPSALPLKKIHIVDKLGIEHTIETEKSGFLLQKRGDLIYPIVKRWIGNNEREKAQELISSLVAFIDHCHKSGIGNEDPSVKKNLGYLEGKLFLLDVGRVTNDPNLQKEAVSLKTMQRTLRPFKKWLRKYDLELADFLEKKMEELHHEGNS